MSPRKQPKILTRVKMRLKLRISWRNQSQCPELKGPELNNLFQNTKIIGHRIESPIGCGICGSCKGKDRKLTIPPKKVGFGREYMINLSGSL